MELFDPTTGQIYHERTCSHIPSMVSSWVHESRNKRVDPSLRRGGARDPCQKACPSLREMALRACVWNVDLFLPETLRWAGWWYAKEIYRELKDREMLSFYTWRIFHEAFPGEVTLSHAFRLRERKDAPSLLQLASVASCLARLDTGLLSFVCLQSSSHVRLEHLVSLTGIPTLAALVLESQETGIKTCGVEEKARECRAWTRMVKEKGALRRLRVLVWCNSGVEREVMLRCVSDFPALCLVGHVDSGVDKSQTSYGGEWQCVQDNRRNGVSDSGSELDPNAIWTRRDLTMTSKVESLYKLSFDLLPRVDARVDACPTVAISYGDGTRHEDSPLHWYLRDPRERSVYAQKRPGDSGASREGEGDGTGKKRKVRPGRQRDVGSMLGAFSA